MGNHHSTSHTALKPRKNVHWKSAGKPATPGKPQIIPLLSDEEPNSITLRWAPAAHDGGAPLQGYQVECNRLGTRDWIRTAPPVVVRPELVLTGLEPPHRYQFRITAINAVGYSDYSELSDVLNINSDRLHEPPIFLNDLEDVVSLENEKTEFRVTFTGSPPPTLAWFKDDYEIFSSRRTAITTTDSTSILIFHQTLSSDEGEIKCTATNRSGHAVVKARLSLESAPKLRYPRQYEDGLLYEINETVFLKTAVVGKPLPILEWRHNGQNIVPDDRIEITNTHKFSMLKIHTSKRSDRGEYQVHAKNIIGEDTASFLVTITAPPDPPRNVSVTRQVDRSITLDWESPEDDGGCRIGNYVIEYYRTGWNVWLKATTSRKTNATLFDLIEGSEYRFRVKAESPYGMSLPSKESSPVRIPGRPVDMEFLAVESRIINEVLTREDGEEPTISPAPRRKRLQTAPADIAFPKLRINDTKLTPRNHSGSNEFMLVLYPDKQKDEKSEKRKSFQLELEDALSPPPISLSAPELSTRTILPFKALRNAVSSTELLHEKAMARFYKAVEMKEEQSKTRNNANNSFVNKTKPVIHQDNVRLKDVNQFVTDDSNIDTKVNNKHNILIKTDSIENKTIDYDSSQKSQESDIGFKWQNISFDEDYTASTVSTDEEYSDDDSLKGDMERGIQFCNEEEIYNPRNKAPRPSPIKEAVEEEEDISETIKLEPLPLPDPNFVPKPILKKRELKIPTIPQSEEKEKENKLKPNKKEKLTIFKKLTKMPVQKSFPFPKLIKREQEGNKQIYHPEEKRAAESKPEKVDDKIGDEGKTVIDYYGNIVKEFGSQKKPATPLYLNTEDLKTIAEKQEDQKDKGNKLDTVPKSTKKMIGPKSYNNKNTKNKINTTNPTSKQAKVRVKPISEKRKPVSQVTNFTRNEKPKHEESYTQQIILKKTERATIVIPINYKELEDKAKVNVRSVIDYMVDLCLLLLAFWVYFFKDERLAIPFLILIIYRQLQETILLNIPQWIRTHTPSWLQVKSL